MPSPRKRIGVIGSGTLEHPEYSVPLGHHLAEQGYHLVNGGGSGTMLAVARAFTEVESRAGLVIGIIPSSTSCNTPGKRAHYQAPEGYPNPSVDLTIRTHLPLSGSSGKQVESRNHIVVLTADLLIALPGSEGTRSEIELALDYKKPIGLLNVNGVWNDFLGSGAFVTGKLEPLFQWIKQKKAGD